MKRFLRHTFCAAALEFRAAVTSPGVLLILMGGVFLYGILYNLLYAPECVEGAPVVVVDHSHTELSRRFVGLVDAAPEITVEQITGNYAEAQTAVRSGRAVGVVEIPWDFEQRLRRGDEAWVLSVASTTSFLNYDAVQSAVAGAMLAVDSELRASMVVFLPTAARAALTRPAAVSVVGEALYNPSHGYAQYLIPPVLVIILFQTLLLAIGMTDAPRRRNFVLWGDAAAEVVGRAVMWTLLYGVAALWLYGFVGRVFGLPHLGGVVATVAVLLPFLLATSLLGVAFARLFSDPEVAPLAIAFFSVGLVFLSGVSYPLELLPEPWHSLRYVLPAPVATFAMVKVGSMGASAADCAGEIGTLWLQCSVYGAICWALMIRRR